jgi:hypothetical protein
MPSRVSKSVVVLLLIASVYGTIHLGRDYFQALSGKPDAQWQFAFVLAPVPIVLGAVAIAVAKFSRPPLPRIFALAAWVAALAPLALLVLVQAHAY